MLSSNKTILIGMPSASGVVPTVMVQSLLQLHKPLPCGFMTIERQRTDKARNYICIEALKNNFDYLFFVDDDNPIPDDTLEKFIEDDKDIVIAPIAGRNPNKLGVHPLCAYYKREIETSAGKIRLYDNITKFKEKGPLHKIDAGGTGAMLIKRKVLEVLFEKYKGEIFAYGEIKFEKVKVDGVDYDRRTMSEDCEFSERAIDAGFEIWLDDRIRPSHLTNTKAIVWEENG